MTLPPEVLFHRYFQELGPWERRKYHGKHDLRGLEPLEQLLIGIQDALNEGLNEEHRDPQHSDCRPFHFDYIDSTVQNARAFRYGSYFFIGITIPLVHALWSSCHLLSRSDLIASALGVRLKGEERDGLRTVSFRTTLSFWRCTSGPTMLTGTWTYTARNRRRSTSFCTAISPAPGTTGFGG
ncbi:MAG: hypothetical protein ABSG65_28880 [Bryobacteraceae bacterium]|jgi:hypothetical protein